MTKYVYMFTEGNAAMKNLLGGKGANLAEMTGLGLPVPRGFTISTEACNQYYLDGETITPEVTQEIEQALVKAEALVGKKFGDVENPFLVSVRSGARASMPGMMDTILNLGLNDKVVEGLAVLRRAHHPRGAPVELPHPDVARRDGEQFWRRAHRRHHAVHPLDQPGALR